MITEAKEYLKSAEELCKADQGDTPIYMNLKFADTAARIAIAEELATMNIKLDNVCYELKSASEGERK